MKSMAVIRGVSVAAALGLVIAWSAGAHAQEITGVTPVEGVTVEQGTPLAEAVARLPTTTTVTVSGGESMPVYLTWSLSEYVATSRGGNIVRQEYLPGIRGPYQMTGTFGLPEGVTRGDPTMPLYLNAEVTIGGATELPTVRSDPALDQPGQYLAESITFGDVERTYNVYVPSGYTGDEPVPVMFTFHGAGSYGAGQMRYSEFDKLAEREGFIVVAPDYGISALGRFETPGVADFTSAMIDELAATYNIDERRIYASGISMGGSASFTLAHQLSDRIAAVAPVASSGRGVLEQELPRPITIVWFYGTRDSGYGPSVTETVDHLASQIGAASQAEVRMWTPTDEDPTGITRLTYGGGEGGTQIVFYRVDEGGHTWPGKYQYASLISVGLTSQHVDATEMIWEHLKHHRLPE